jgi:CDP-paratose 2-epimerase
MITRFGDLFDWLELWNHPESLNEWDTRMDADWSIFTEMVGGAAYWIHERGKKVVLPALWHRQKDWIELMSRRGVLSHVDAISVHALPSSPEFGWRGWQKEVGDVRESLHKLGVNPEVWITETGFSTWRGDEHSQVVAFADAASAPVERMYWRELFDKPAAGSDSGHFDERDYHYGILRADGSSKLLHSRWFEDGLESVLKPARILAKPCARRALITGGAGFIGTNLAEQGHYI